MKNFRSSLSSSPAIRGIYPPIYVSDLKKSMEWYCSCLRFRVLSCNPNYATMEMAPGLFCFMNENKEKSGTSYANVYMPEAAVIHLQLADHGIDIGPLHKEETTWFTFRDPDGNEFSVMSGLFGVDHLDYRLKPEHQRSSKWGFLYTSMPHIHCIGIKVTGSGSEPSEEDFEQAAARLENAAKHMQDVKPATFRVTQTIRFVEEIKQLSYFVCQETANRCVPPDGCTAFTIDAQQYAVFEYPLSSPKIREEVLWQYIWPNRQFGFTKPENGHVEAMLLEFVRDDCIELFCPISAATKVTTYA